MVVCPFCKGTGKMYEVNYRSWYDKSKSPTDINELIEERDCSYCMGRKEVADKDNIKVD